MPPLLTHTSLVLHNWHRLDPSGPVRAENLACNCRFLGGLDETWFYIATVEIEARGGGVFGALLEVGGWLHGWVDSSCCSRRSQLAQALKPISLVVYCSLLAPLLLKWCSGWKELAWLHA